MVGRIGEDMALKKCIDCKHCKGVMEHCENVPKFFSTFLNFYCLKFDKCLGRMVTKEEECFPCFEKRSERGAE